MAVPVGSRKTVPIKKITMKKIAHFLRLMCPIGLITLSVVINGPSLTSIVTLYMIAICYIVTGQFARGQFAQNGPPKIRLG